MSSNNQNKIPEWVKRVREYDVIPDDVVYSEEETWQLLQSRYENKPAKRRRYFYWAAAVTVALLVVPLLWTRQISNKEKLQNENPVAKQATQQKPIENLIKKDSQKLMVHEDQNQVEVKKYQIVSKEHENKSVSVNPKDTTLVVKNDDTSNVNNSIAIKNIQDTIDDENASIVHINTINSTKPEQEFDGKKLRRFMRKYDVDAPTKNSATGSTKIIPLLNNIN